MKLACLVTLVIVLRASAGPLLDDVPHTFCGRHLANARLLYCFGATESMRKRSDLKSSLMLAILRAQTTSTEIPEQRLLETDRDETTNPQKHIGIADECCLKPCFISDLLNYC